jgi:hypothetical protein
MHVFVVLHSYGGDDTRFSLLLCLKVIFVSDLSPRCWTRSLLGVTRKLGGIKGRIYRLKFAKLMREAKSTWESGLVRDKMWLKEY